MPPRFTYWTIILDGQPTAFRAADRETLLPTLKQLQSKNPDAVMKWFARGRIWDSPEEARAALRPPRKSAERAGPTGQGGERRGPGWRPGGSHKDPREKFKKETFQARRRRERKAAAVGMPPAGRDSRWDRSSAGSHTRPPAKPRAGGRRPFAGPKGGVHARPERHRDWRSRDRDPRGHRSEEPAKPETPAKPEAPVVQEPRRPAEPERPPTQPREQRPELPSAERIRILPEPPEQGAPPRPSSPAPPHETKMPRLRRK